MRVLVIDAGHGGDDPGATADGVEEADVTLLLACELKSCLEALDLPVSVHLTRESREQTMSLKARGGMAKKIGAQLVLSIHCNAASAAASGSRGFHLPTSPLAREILLRMMAHTAFDLRSQSVTAASSLDWTKRAYNVCSAFSCSCALYEVGFLSSLRDRRILMSPAGQWAIVASCVFGLLPWIQGH